MITFTDWLIAIVKALLFVLLCAFIVACSVGLVVGIVHAIKGTVEWWFVVSLFMLCGIACFVLM